MSPLTIFLAKLLGLYCIIVPLAMMTRKQSAVAAVKALISNPPLLLFVEVLERALVVALQKKSRIADPRKGAMITGE